MASKDPIENVIILMMENRTYDFMFGYLDRGEGVQSGRHCNSFLLDTACTSKPAPSRMPHDPPHEFDDTSRVLFGTTDVPDPPAATMSGFMDNYARDITLHPGLIMKCADPAQIPAYATLAENYLLFDHWFASVPGPTWPNRLFTHCATAGGQTSGDVEPSYDLPSIQGRMNQHGVTWKVYDYGPDSRNPSIARNISDIAGDATCFDLLDNFFVDLENDNLPQYAFLMPNIAQEPGGNSQHPTECLECGDQLIAAVYNQLFTSSVWGKCLFLITYDEHGGFYDHVPPPYQGIPAPDDRHEYGDDFDFRRLGLRVPTVLISPYAPNHVCSELHEHSSIVRTLRERFGLGEPLTRRDAWARRFDEHLLSTPRTDLPYPLESVAAAADCKCPTLPVVGSSGD